MAACLPDHLFSVDGKVDDDNFGGVVHERPAAASELAAFDEDAEGEWAAVAVANAGLADGPVGRPACRVPRALPGPRIPC